MPVSQKIFVGWCGAGSSLWGKLCNSTAKDMQCRPGGSNFADMPHALPEKSVLGEINIRRAMLEILYLSRTYFMVHSWASDGSRTNFRLTNFCVSFEAKQINKT